IGDNLPNENEIHEKYGTKNFLFTSSTRALNNATGDVMAKEFSASPEIAERSVKYGNEAGDLMTALHEVIGHGSGKLSERLKGGAEPYLKGYFSTLEEGRALHPHARPRSHRTIRPRRKNLYTRTGLRENAPRRGNATDRINAHQSRGRL